MGFESRFRGDLLSAHRAGAVLLAPNGQQPFPALRAVEQLFAFAFLIVSGPFLIEGICFPNDFPESDNLRIGRIDQLEIGRFGSFGLVIHFRRKRPHAVSDVMPVFPGNPAVALVLMSALCPLPQAFVDLVIHETEHFGRYDVPMVVNPPTDNGIEPPDQLLLSSGFTAFNDLSHFLQERLDSILGWFDQQFSIILSDVLTQEVKAIIDVCDYRFLFRQLQSAFAHKCSNHGQHLFL